MSGAADRLAALSPAKRALFELLRKQQPGAAAQTTIPRLAVRSPAPLSFAQERLWFLYRLDPDNAAYTVPYAVRYQGVLPAVVVERALEYLVARHETLRTTVGEVDGRPMQRITAKGSAHLSRIELGAGSGNTADEVAAIAREAFERPFSLEDGPLFRTTHITSGADQHVLIFVMHHIISDAGSLERLVREFAACCAAFAAGQEPRLPALPIQFADFAAWQRDWFSGAVRDDQVGYWTKQLSGLQPVDLPTDTPRSSVQTFRGRVLRFEIPTPVFESLRQLARRHDATPFMTLLAGFAAFLHRYSRQADIAVGSPVANRARIEMEHLIGLFANTIVLRIDCSGSPSADALIARTREVVLDAHAHQDLPFEQLVEALQPTRDLSRNPLFQVFFAYRGRGRDQGAAAPDALEVETSTTKFDLTLTFEEATDRLHGLLEYNTDLFLPGTISRMAGHLTTMLAGMADDPSRAIDDLPLLARDERDRALGTGSAEPCVVGTADTLPALFAGTASNRADHEALVCGADRLTYRELADRSARIAAVLRARGVGEGSLVAIALERSVTMVAAALGIVRAGAAYVPLDPAFPAERLRVTIEDARPAAILTAADLVAALPLAAVAATTVIVIDAVGTQRELASIPPADAVPVDPEALAYVLFTSGSTGRPKGVQVPHGALAAFLDATGTEPGLTASDRLVAVTTLAFDIAGLELWLPLTTGATVVLASSEESRDGRRLADLIARERATVLQATPSTWRLLLDAGWRNPERLKVLVGGEPLPVDLARDLIGISSDVWNMYGPTETTIWSAVHRVTSAERAIPIGHPIPGTRVYVLDDRLEPVPFGVCGDLYISGAGLARGYLHLPHVTAEAFGPDPHATGRGTRMYRTGDLARMRPDGALDFVGRRDGQVKLRGFRIELGDVEAALAAHPSVAQAVAGVRMGPGAEAVLAAWVIPASGQPFEQDVVRTFLRERLPDYMVPSSWAVVEVLPLTPNGKIDRRALPDPIGAGVGNRAPVRAPSNDIERTLVGIWREMLGADVQGVDEDFFDLGGHSMLAARLLSRVRDVFETDVPLRLLFERPTVAGLARAVAIVKQGGTLDVLSPALRATMLADAVLDPAIRPGQGFNRPSLNPRPQAGTSRHVLLTGATGFLGAHLLAELLADSGTTVSCLVRCREESAGAARVRETLGRFEIRDDGFDSRIAIVPGDLDRPRLGLSAVRFEALGEALDAIYHNGALVNFVTPYRQLHAANVLGTIEVLRLAATGRSTPLHYVSTTDVLGGSYYTTREDDTVDELNGLAYGYAQSKWVAEHLVQAAAARGLPVAIYRPGRIIGHSRTGIWNTDDFACRAIRGSIELRVVPDIDPLDNMSPVDYVAAAIASISRGPEAFAHRAFHVINPAYFLWRDLFAIIRGYGYPLDVVPYREWRARLAADASNPLAPLLPLFPIPPDHDDHAGLRWSSIPIPNCAVAQAALEGTGVTCPPLDEGLWNTYFDFFHRIGYIERPVTGASESVGGRVRPGAN